MNIFIHPPKIRIRKRIVISSPSPSIHVLSVQSGGPMRNMVVGIVCAVLVLIHLLVGLIAHKLDHLDSVRLSQVPLCGRPGLYHYRVLVKTGWRRGAGQPRTSQRDVDMKSEDRNTRNK